MSDSSTVHHLGTYRGYELSASEDRYGVFTGYARLEGEKIGSAGDGLAFSVSRLSLHEAEGRLRELVDEELGPDLDDTDVDLTARLQRLQRERS